MVNLMNHNTQAKTQFGWVWRLLPSIIFLALGWIYRNAIFAWASQSWKRNIVLGIFVLAILDILLTIQKPISLLSTKLARMVKRWSYKKSQSDSKKPSNNSADRPITSISDDRLGFVKYAFVLADNIAHCETPMTFGIHGEWGAGKTSLANLIQQFLTPRNNKNKPYELQLGGRNIEESFPNELLEQFEIINIDSARVFL